MRDLAASRRTIHRRPLVKVALFILIMALAHPSSLAWAQEPASERDLVHRTDSLASATLAAGRVAGLAVGVRRNGEVLLARGYGWADKERQVEATERTVFRVGSLTKQVTASAILRLVEDGRLDLDASLSALPWFSTQSYRITLRHLLTHTHGIPSYTELQGWNLAFWRDSGEAEVTNLLAGEPLRFRPGTRFLYGNSGYFLLGVIIRDLTGSSAFEYMAREILDPLGLEDSSFCQPEDRDSGSARGYELVEGSLLSAPALSTSALGAAAGLCSSVEDLLTWSLALRSGGVIPIGAYDEMTRPYRLADRTRTNYGFGLVIDDLEGYPRIGHYGDVDGFSSQMAFYPEQDLDVVVLSNTRGPEPMIIEEAIARWALGVPPAVAEKQVLPAEALARYQGTYRPEQGGDGLRVFIRGGSLFIQNAEGPGEERLYAQGDHTFRLESAPALEWVFDVPRSRAETLVIRGGTFIRIYQRVVERR